MIGIKQTTKGKPCTCPSHKVCTHCKKKKTKPHIYVEDANRLPFPIKITRHQENKNTKEQKTITKKDPKRKEKITKHKEEKQKKWDVPTIQAPLYSYYADTRRKSRLSDWYQKRRATKELKKYYKLERKREKKEKLEREKARSLKEKEVFQKLNYKPEPQKKIFTKPPAEPRYIPVKTYNRYDDISDKFVNCCYRLCCQFYCCFSCIILIGFAIIFL